MWEEYLERAVSAIPNKYRARRLKARLRAQLLDIYHEAVGQGMVHDRASAQAMRRLGTPEAVAVRLTAPERQQHGWLWSISVIELVVGLAIMTVSMHSQYLAGMAFGRLVSLWGVLATALHSRHPSHLLRSLRSLRQRQPWGHYSGRIVLRAMGVGAVSGALGGLLLIVPWNLINANVIDPVVLSEVSMVAVAVAVALGPWMVRPAWRNQFLVSVALQVYAGTAAALTYAGLLWWHPGLVPPPFFNWNLPLTAFSGFAAYFGCIRLYRFWVQVREPIDSWPGPEELDQAI